MANQRKAKFVPEENDLIEQPRPAPLPSSKPSLEDVFERRDCCEPLLTLKSLQAERTRHKLLAWVQRSRLNHIQETQPLTDFPKLRENRPGRLSLNDLSLSQPSLRAGKLSRHGSASERVTLSIEAPSSGRLSNRKGQRSPLPNPKPTSSPTPARPMKQPQGSAHTVSPTSASSRPR